MPERDRARIFKRRFHEGLIPSFSVDYTRIVPGIFTSRVDTLGDQRVTTYDVRRFADYLAENDGYQIRPESQTMAGMVMMENRVEITAVSTA